MEPDTRTLLEMLATRRPAWSKSERKFIWRFLSPLGLDIDDFGNYSKRIGRAPVLWSCHTDTVHRKGGHQRIAVRGQKVTLHENSDSNCLGADDTAGIWIMREMILANVPGLYIFHRAEEIGGQGSDYIAKHTPNALCGIKYAIALDRRGTNSVITHQGYGRCCSQAFARELSKSLRHGFTPDSTGVFTDTANYVDIVPECTNLSVGYDHEHTSREMLNLDHVFTLRNSLMKLDTTALPVERDPSIVEHGEYMGDIWDHICILANSNTSQDEGHAALAAEMIRRNPEHAAELLRAYGLRDTDIIDELCDLGATLPH